ncbi:unnamed protein product [Durusdinium trenchii]|uniref:Uncharacterized protein n=1 Tax=Durusdinium trenchii TaxID=1381693 RepID=A0ABP0QHX2_9DINO
MPRRFIDVDWNKQHLSAVEWEQRHERRLLQRLSDYHRSVERRPWVALGSKADADLATRLKSASSAAAAPSRSKSEADVGGPKTPSTSLSTLWRRALQPESRTSPSPSRLSSGASERALQRLQASEAWQKACAKLDQDELIELVGLWWSCFCQARRLWLVFVPQSTFGFAP